MNFSAYQKTAKPISDMRRSYPSMNRIKLYASFAIIRCRKSIQCLESNLREAASTRRIIRNTALTSTYANGLDTSGTLQARAFRGSERAASRIARSVAVAIGIGLSMQTTAVGQGSIDATKPKDYIRSIMPKHEAICLSRLIGKESAWNPKAVGNLSSPTKSYVYGLLQLKNPIVKDKSAIEQIHYGLKYINHRYEGSTCKAWNHWQRKGWH